MDSREYEKILDAVPALGIYVVRADNHEILYFNSSIRDMVPDVYKGMKCDGLWTNSCAVCPLQGMGEKDESSSIICDGPFGGTVDITAKRVQWENHVPAFVVTILPHKDEINYVYRKILRVNLSSNTYDSLKLNVEEQAMDGTADSFSELMGKLTENGGIHPEDADRFLSFTHLDYLRSALRAGRKVLTCSYRRRSPEGFRWNMMEVLPDSSYTDENQVVLIYMKDIHDMLKESLELDESSVRLQEVARTLGEQNFGIYAIDLKDGKVNLVREEGYVQEGLNSWTLMWDVVMRTHLVSQIHPEDRDKFAQKFSLKGLHRTRKSGVQKTDMLCQWRSGDTYRYVAVVAYFGRKQNYTILALQDVDERVRQEMVLSQRDMQMAAILKSRFSVMTTVDLDSGQCERFSLNENAEPQQVSIGSYTYYYQQALNSVVSQEDRDKYRQALRLEHLQELAENTRDYREEVCQYRVTLGDTQWLEQHVTYIRRGGQVMINILGRDITQEKLEEEERIRAKQEQEGIIKSLGGMFFATYYGDLEQETLRAITQLEEVETVVGSYADYTTAIRTYAEHFVHPEDRAGYLYTMSIKNLRQVLRPEQPFVTFAYRKQPNNTATNMGNCGWIRATAVMAQADEEGRVKSIVYAAQDVTESKQKEMREQLAIQAACEAANHANASKSEFLSRMSHDILTPMNGIIGMGKIAASHMDDRNRVEDCLGKIMFSGTRLLTLVQEILDMNDIESGNVDLASDSFGLSEFIQDIADTLLPEAEGKGVALRVLPVEIENDKVVGDRTRLRQVFLNILGNSVKYTPAGGFLELKVAERETKRYGCCSYDFIFRDNGIGMEENYIPHIFEPFSRAEDSRISKTEGAGLGMTIAQNFIRMMGGSIQVESVLGEGTQVTVTLLLKLQNSDRGAQDTADEQGEDLSDTLFRGYRVLLVEDNAINQEIAMEIIGATGASVECASDGREALNRFGAAQEGYFDMIFMDIQMPVMNGYEATRAIRKLPRRDAVSIPIIALSANCLTEDIAASRAAGMNEHMTKPLEVSHLIAEMSRWLVN